MTYEQALAFWFAHVNYEQRAPTAADLVLDRMRSLLHRLGDPHRRLRLLHIAGSKGKGSTSALLAAILRRAGYRTGLFTSPHLVHIEERFQVNGVPIGRDELTQLLADVKAATEAAPRPAPTFFEICTALGFLHFQRRRCDAAVLEVGLGGRLDSTNVCFPRVSVITSISLDHTRVLGDRLALIAREKAGIIKPRVPVISGVAIPEPRAVIEEVARARRAPLTQIDADFQCEYRPGHLDADRPAVRVTTRQRAWPWLELNLLGAHQAANAAVAVATVEELRGQGWSISDEAVAAGLREAEWPARLEVVRRDPLVVLDCAHNVASAQALVRTLDESFPPVPRTLLFAGSSDKDVAGMFGCLAPAFGRAILTRYTNNPRAIPPEELARAWRQAGGTEPTIAATPAEGLALALQLGGLVCVTGSVFLAGEVRPMLVGDDAHE